MKKNCTLAVMALAMTGTASTAFGGIIAPDAPYKSFGDSPFVANEASGNHWLEDFESGVFDSLGVTSSGGNVKAPSSKTDSVDFDDGVLDGLGRNGHSYGVNSSLGGVTFTFDAGALGQLPTYAGVAWTDGNSQGNLTFEAFDADNNLIDSIVVTLNHGPNGSTDEDRFLGVEFASGISSIVLTASTGGFELDHLQYGFSVVPLPAPILMGMAGLAAVGLRRRRSRVA